MFYGWNGIFILDLCCTDIAEIRYQVRLLQVINLICLFKWNFLLQLWDIGIFDSETMFQNVKLDDLPIYSETLQGFELFDL